MSTFGNMLSGIGAVGNMMGIEGADNVGGLNAMQRAGFAANNPQAYAQFQRQSAIAQLAQDPEFIGLPPAEKAMAIAHATGSPDALTAANQMSAVAGVDMNDPRSAISKLQPYMTPDSVISTMTDPMKQGMLGTPTPALTAMNGSGASLGSANGSPTPGAGPAPLPWQSGGTPPAPAAAPATNQPLPSNTGQEGDGRNWNYLNSQIPPFYRNQVLDYSQGGELPKDVSPKDKTLIANWAHNFDPSFTELVGQQRSNTVKSFAPEGKSGQAITSIGTGTKHLGQLALAQLGLGNSNNSRLRNWIGNTASDWWGGDATNTFNSLVNTVAPEVAKAANSGGETSEGDRAAQRADFSTTGNNPQNLSAIAEKTKLMRSKAEELEGTYKKNMGPVNKGFKALSPATIQLQKDLDSLHSLSKIDPDLKGAEAKKVIARIQEAVNLDDSAFLPDGHTPVPGGAADQKAATPTAEDALAELKRRGKVQ